MNFVDSLKLMDDDRIKKLYRDTHLVPINSSLVNEKELLAYGYLLSLGI